MRVNVKSRNWRLKRKYPSLTSKITFRDGRRSCPLKVLSLRASEFVYTELEQTPAQTLSRRKPTSIDPYGLTDPHNLGSYPKNIDATNAHVIIPKHRVAPGDTQLQTATGAIGACAYRHVTNLIKP